MVKLIATPLLFVLALLGFTSSVFAAEEVKLFNIQTLGLPAPGKCLNVSGRMLCAGNEDPTRLSLITVSSSGEGTMQPLSVPPSGKCSRVGDNRLVLCAPEGGSLLIIPSMQ